MKENCGLTLNKSSMSNCEEKSFRMGTEPEKKYCLDHSAGIFGCTVQRQRGARPESRFQGHAHGRTLEIARSKRSDEVSGLSLLPSSVAKIGS